MLATDTLNAIFRDIDSFARNSEFPTYDPKTGEGFWRHLVVREAKKTGEIMLVFSVNGVWNSSDSVIAKNEAIQVSGKIEHGLFRTSQ